ncbi:hypothetical protein ABZX40_39075 [Streptomyces sp. NPDC004610]|uniref:hypothetical protein n=1 Tax=unclassified Streptomyces TaxID=2593676 RepID=UPI0033AE8E5B
MLTDRPGRRGPTTGGRGRSSLAPGATGNTAGGAAAAFTALDVRGRGTVDRDTYLAAIHDFLTTGTSPMADAYPDPAGTAAS